MTSTRTTTAKSSSQHFSFLYVFGLLVVFMVGYMMGEQHLFLFDNEERAVTKPAHNNLKSSSSQASTTTNEKESSIRSTMISTPYNISFDPIDCSAYPGRQQESQSLQAIGYTSNHSKLQGSTYYLSKPVAKHMGYNPTQMMEYVVNATSTSPDELFVDIGGNIGIYTMSAMTLGIPTLSVEPIAYNLMLLCEGYRKNIEAKMTKPPTAAQFTLIKAAIANEFKPEMNISHPTASFGKQDQASLFANTIGVVRKPVLEVETVPLLRLDQVIPDTIPVGFVKIDVQGAEFWVLQGMRGLLERDTGFPKVIWYEEQASVLQKANIATLGQNQKYLESFGYKCRTLRNDVICQKERA